MTQSNPAPVIIVGNPRVETLENVEPAEDASEAGWLVESIREAPFAHVGSIIPSVYPAYARILHPAARCQKRSGVETRETISWAEIAKLTGRTVHALAQWPNIVGRPRIDREVFGVLLSSGSVLIDDPLEGSLPAAVARRLAERLREHTDNPADCFFGVWVGFGDASYRVSLIAPTFGTQSRTYYLLNGPLECIASSFHGKASGWSAQSANLMWSRTRDWCVATEIDCDSTFVGGSERLIEHLLSDPELETHPSDPGDSVSYGSDHINPEPRFHPFDDRIVIEQARYRK